MLEQEETSNSQKLPSVCPLGSMHDQLTWVRGERQRAESLRWEPQVKAVPESLQRIHHRKLPPAIHPRICPKLALTIQTAKCPHRILYLLMPLGVRSVRAPSTQWKVNTHFHKHHLIRNPWDSSTMWLPLAQRTTWPHRIDFLHFQQRVPGWGSHYTRNRVKPFFPNTPRGQLCGRYQTAPRAPSKRQLWNTLKNWVIKDQ